MACGQAAEATVCSTASPAPPLPLPHSLIGLGAMSGYDARVREAVARLERGPDYRSLVHAANQILEGSVRGSRKGLPGVVALHGFAAAVSPSRLPLVPCPRTATWLRCLRTLPLAFRWAQIISLHFSFTFHSL